MNLLLDTNVIIDYIGQKPPFYLSAERVIAAGYFGDVTLWASAASLKNAFYVLDRYVDSVQIQRAIIKFCEVVSLVSLSEDDVLRAARLEWSDFEDCLIALCAEKAKADYLITRDSGGFARSAVPALSPDAWLDLMKEEYGLDYSVVE